MKDKTLEEKQEIIKKGFKSIRDAIETTGKELDAIKVRLDKLENQQE